MVLAVVVWFFYLLICPVVTLAVIASKAKEPAETVRGNVRRAASTIATLTLILGPVHTDAGLMPWWDVPFMTSFAKSELYFLEYAGVCAVLYAALYAVQARRRSAKRRSEHVGEG